MDVERVRIYHSLPYFWLCEYHQFVWCGIFQMINFKVNDLTIHRCR